MRISFNVLSRPRASGCTQYWALRGIRWSSTEPVVAPPLLAKMRGDLKTAMREKDTVRLNVLRNVISEISNASKTSSPIHTDLQLLSILRKKAGASKLAAQSFDEADRNDLKQKQEAELAVLDEYAGRVTVMSREEVELVVDEAINAVRAANAKINQGMVMKELLRAEGKLYNKPVDKAQVSEIIKSRLE